MTEAPPEAAAPPPRAPVPAPDDEGWLHAQIHQAMRRLAEPRRPSWLGALVVVGTLIVFVVSLQVYRASWLDALFLTAAILFHELGHLAGMWLFGYRDVRLFFIPFLGAAVSGHKASAEGYQRAAVTLLGPLPGLALGTVLLAAGLWGGPGWTRAAAFVLLVLNGINLLPVYPLDGGRLLHDVLFCRSRWIEALSKLAGGGLLLAVALAMWFGAGPWAGAVLALMALAVLLPVTHNFRVAGIAERLRAAAGDAWGEAEAPSLPQTVAVIRGVRAVFPAISDPRALASLSWAVWQRLQTRVPGLGATLAFLAVYGFVWFCLLMLAVALAALGR